MPKQKRRHHECYFILSMHAKALLHCPLIHYGYNYRLANIHYYQHFLDHKLLCLGLVGFVHVCGFIVALQTSWWSNNNSFKHNSAVFRQIWTFTLIYFESALASFCCCLHAVTYHYRTHKAIVLNKVICLKQAIFKCPFCNNTTWHTRIMLWKHMMECMHKATQPIEIFTAPESAIAVSQ